jgi:hypothetical protein
MGSDPGSDLPPVQDFSQKENSEPKIPSGERCGICGLVARNKVELDEHINYAHRQGEPSNTNDVYSNEQKIDPFVKTED